MSEFWLVLHISASWLHVNRNILPNWSALSLIIYYQPQIFFLFSFLLFGGVILIEQTKFELSVDFFAFELIKNGKDTHFKSVLLSLLKIGCLWPILALLGGFSISKNIRVLLVLSACCLLENSKLYIIQKSLSFWHIPVSRDQTRSPSGAWEVSSTFRAHHPEQLFLASGLTQLLQFYHHWFC